MAPEQGPDSKSKSGKTDTTANEDESSQKHNGNATEPLSISHTLSTDTLGWIYILRKEQLIEHCRRCGIITDGFTVGHLRKKLTDHIRAKRLRASSENLLKELENEVKSAENAVISDEVVNLAVPTNSVTSGCAEISVTEIMRIVQRWDLKFNGDTDIVEFLERFEELAECYNISLNRLLPALLGVLNGNALKWYRVKRAEITTWANLKHEAEKFFLPRRHLTHLEQTFYNRKQNNHERAKDYVLNMLTLARQYPQLRGMNHLDRIYDGLRSEPISPI